MSISIAGRTVMIGDPLYHTGLRSWGTVIGYDGGSAKVEISTGGQPRTVYVQQGGRVNNVRVMYWHEPIIFDMPFQNIDKYQRLLDAITVEFPS